MLVVYDTGTFGGTWSINSPEMGLLAAISEAAYALARVKTRSLSGARTHVGMTTETMRLLTQEQAAEFLQIPPRTLEAWRLHKGGPPFVRLGRHVRYVEAELHDWVRAQAEAQAGAKAKGAA